MSVLSLGLSIVRIAGEAGRTVLFKIYENMVNTNWEDHTRNWEDIQ